MTRHTIQVGNTNLPHGILILAESLPNRDGVRAGDEVVFAFSGTDYVNLPGLVLLATWRKSLPPNVSARIDDSRCTFPAQNLLSNSGFREIVETGHEAPSAQRRSGRLPIRPLTNRLNHDAAVQDVTSVFEETADHVSDVKSVKTIISELCENALTHSEFASPSYVSARAQEQVDQRRLEIALCDSGIGIRESYLTGTNEEAKERIARGADPIDLAVSGQNSSRPIPRAGEYRSNMGLGLFITRRLVEENRGQLMIVSQRDAIHCVGHISRNTYTLRNAFPGTFVVALLDPDNPLPLEEVYEEATRSVVGDMPGLTVSKGVAKESPPQPVGASTAAPTMNGRNGIPAQPGVLALRYFGTELLTRDVGLAIRAELATRLVQHGSVSVDLDGISDITPSVADEVFGKLALALGMERFAKVVLLRGGSSLARRLIEFVVKNRVK